MPEKEIQNDLSPSRVDYLNIDLTHIYIYYIIDISNISTSFLKYDKSTQGCFQRTGHRPTSSHIDPQLPTVRRSCGPSTMDTAKVDQDVEDVAFQG